jgi:hypothetical protein
VSKNPLANTTLHMQLGFSPLYCPSGHIHLAIHRGEPYSRHSVDPQMDGLQVAQTFSAGCVWGAAKRSVNHFRSGCGRYVSVARVGVTNIVLEHVSWLGVYADGGKGLGPG